MNEQTQPAGNSPVERGLGLLPERADLYDDIICKIRFDPLTRSEQYAQIERAVAAERERCAGVCDTIYAIDSAHAAKVCAAAIRGRIREHCPFPWTGDNGSVAQCKERGHCGCGA